MNRFYLELAPNISIKAIPVGDNDGVGQYMTFRASKEYNRICHFKRWDRLAVF